MKTICCRAALAVSLRVAIACIPCGSAPLLAFHANTRKRTRVPGVRAHGRSAERGISLDEGADGFRTPAGRAALQQAAVDEVARLHLSRIGDGEKRAQARGERCVPAGKPAEAAVFGGERDEASQRPHPPLGGKVPPPQAEEPKAPRRPRARAPNPRAPPRGPGRP